MAIDSAAKRASVLSFGLIACLVIPDGTIAQADRQTIAGVYSGIDASNSSTPATVITRLGLGGGQRAAYASLAYDVTGTANIVFPPFVVSAAGGSGVAPTVGGLEYTLTTNKLHYTIAENKLHYTIAENKLQFTVPKDNLHYTVDK